MSALSRQFFIFLMFPKRLLKLKISITLLIDNQISFPLALRLSQQYKNKRSGKNFPIFVFFGIENNYEINLHLPLFYTSVLNIMRIDSIINKFAGAASPLPVAVLLICSVDIKILPSCTLQKYVFFNKEIDMKMQGHLIKLYIYIFNMLIQ